MLARAEIFPFNFESAIVRSRNFEFEMKKNIKSAVIKAGCGLMVGMLAPGVVHACACGCGIFDVGTSSMFPQDSGGTAYFSYSYEDQNRNWNGTSQAPSLNNNDKEIRTDFFTTGIQYMFNSSWGAQLQVPFAYRYFKTVNDANLPVSTTWGSLGDIRVEGIYTGFSPDLSTGITFGFKLPTGNDDYNPSVVDRDTQIGSGSTDILLGGFHRGNLTEDEKWDWFAQAGLDVPVLIQAGFRPGVELNTAAGIDYKGFSLGRVKISPVAQAIFSYRSGNSGDAADSEDSGYERLLLSPGVEFHIHPVKIYADVELPAFQNVNGNQLVAPVLFKVNVSYMF
jgi:hypothetical protein